MCISKKAIGVIFFASLFLTIVSAQSTRESQWIIGDEEASIILDFNKDSLELLSAESSIIMSRPAISNICDTLGEIIMYTNGCELYNRNNELVSGGEEMTIIEEVANQCEFGYNNMLFSSLFLPAPCQEDIVYYINPDYIIDNWLDISSKLYYTKIDVSNSSAVDILEKHQIIFSDTLATGNVHATRHSNGRDWWICVLERQSNCYNCVLLNEQGFSSSVVTCTGYKWNNSNSSDTGSACFSKDGTTYVRFNYTEGLNIYDFDNHTGILTHRERILFPDEDFRGFSGVAISPNSRYVYAAAKFELFQFDLMANPVISSRTLIDSLDLAVSSPTLFTFSKLAPDGKIYITGLRNGFIHVINYPDLQGKSCGLSQHSLILPTVNGQQVKTGSFPNIPHFGPAPDNSVCDSLLFTTSTKEITHKLLELRLFPNPVSEIIHFELDKPAILKNVSIRDVMGRNVLDINIDKQDTRAIDVGNLDNGVYYFFLGTNEGVLTSKFLICN